MLAREALGEIDAEGFASLRRQFEVNALGPCCVAQALLPHLRRDGKIAILTSRMGSVADNTSGGYYGYRASGGSQRHRKVAGGGPRAARHRRVPAASGFVATDMVGGRSDLAPAQAAQQLDGLP